MECGGEQLYYVTHEPSQPIKGRVLLLGPMPSERHYAYASWVEWARFLANRGLAVLRFDYRASGESTGAFADTDCQAWLEDACALIPRIPGAETPLTLCGLRLGGLLGARLLEDGQAKRLLAWAPPKGGREHMMEHLRRRLAEDMAMELPAPRKTRQDYIAELEEGQGLQVDGYIWTKRFWDSCLDLAAPRQVPGTSQLVHTTHTERDLQTMTTAEWKVQIPRPAFWFEGPWFRPELGSLFSASADWIMARTTDQEVRA
ncbi:MAG: hypothetical protein CMJ87_11755 [Planctomycetes bacterium]|nr:hypothetical protein [Planctomycetota bacterium]